MAMTATAAVEADGLYRFFHAGGGPAAVPPDRLLDELGLVERATSWPATLSGGEAARAGLALALANDPTALLADEPTGELDVATADHIVGLLANYAANGHAVV